MKITSVQYTSNEENSFVIWATHAHRTPETAELEDLSQRNLVELADFSGLERQLSGLTLSPALAAVLAIINT